MFASRKLLVSLIATAFILPFSVHALDTKTTDPVAPVNKFSIKSATVTMTMSMTQNAGEGAPQIMGSTGTITMYFDNFGAQECLINEVNMEMMGMKISSKTSTIIKDGNVYLVNPDKKEVIKTKIVKLDDPMKIDYANMSEEFKKLWNIKKDGSASIAGKMCDIYSFATDDIQAALPKDKRKSKDKVSMSGQCWVWNNVGLKADFTLNSTMNIKTEATKIDETSPVDAKVFTIPAGFKVKDE